MIDYTPTALAHVRALTAHYRRKKRPEAIANLRASLSRAEATIEAGAPLARPFPASYDVLVRSGREWLREGAYWIAFDRTAAPVIVAVFWSGADIAGRMPAEA